MGELKEALDMLKAINLEDASLIHLQMWEDAIDIIQLYIDEREEK